MDLLLVNKGFEFTRKKKKWVLLLAAFGVTGYGAYRVYNSPSVARKRKKFVKLCSALVSIIVAVSDSAETIGILSKDLREFLQSDSDDIPNSLKQISKLAQSDDFSDSVVRITAALTRGVFRGYQAEYTTNDTSKGESNSGFYDRFMDKLLSESGSGFASVVIGSFARNLVTAFYSIDEESARELNSGVKKNADGSVLNEAPLPRWVDAMCSDRCRDLFGECIEKFVSTAVAVYLDKTMNVNTYDELFAGLTNPKHNKQVRDLLVTVCNGSIETLVKTSHQVLTSPESGEKVGSDSSSSSVSRFVVTRSNSDVVSKTLCSMIDDAHNVISVKQNELGRGKFNDSKESRKSSSGSWMSTMSSTLAEPSNRKLVLDVTGRVTFETVRSFLEFLLGRLFSSVKRSVRAVNSAIIDTGHHVVRYVTAKSYIVATICISLCLHILGGPWQLMPA
ncbi:protein PHLOEM PROTEIN 2-LIKE A10-like [Chenopodium quinoa]|uniref:protein PHLOEM PROTEIN 2-LIKE A10-like n=1 Tax=Chenopodium quinoa TaxID=63459 RepID=UPI000B799FD8|nr:protein PHLOEM PROTEIN 2-LIKE A10-like [Chenopodium quinoa]